MKEKTKAESIKKVKKTAQKASKTTLNKTVSKKNSGTFSSRKESLNAAKKTAVDKQRLKEERQKIKDTENLRKLLEKDAKKAEKQADIEKKKTAKSRTGKAFNSVTDFAVRKTAIEKKQKEEKQAWAGHRGGNEEVPAFRTDYRTKRKNSFHVEFKSENGKNIKWTMLGIVVFVILAGTLYIGKCYNVTVVTVEGNVHYTDKEIEDIVMAGPLGNNSLYLSLKYKNKGIENVPFVETMDVSIVSPKSIQITVYEKALAGYVEYLGQYMYFDKDGIIVEGSNVKTSSIPQVTGLNFGYVVLYEKLPVDSDDIFKEILSITQLLTK